MNVLFRVRVFLQDCQLTVLSTHFHEAKTEPIYVRTCVYVCALYIYSHVYVKVARV